MERIERAVIRRMDDRQRLRRSVGKLLFDHKGRRDLVALVEILVGDEAVELRAQRDGLDEGCHNEVEHRVGELRFALVALFEIRIEVRQVDRLRDVRFVVTAIGVDEGRNEVHPVQIAQQRAVFSVAPATFLLFHILFTHLRQKLTRVL